MPRGNTCTRVRYHKKCGKPQIFCIASRLSPCDPTKQITTYGTILAQWAVESQVKFFAHYARTHYARTRTPRTQYTVQRPYRHGIFGVLCLFLPPVRKNGKFYLPCIAKKSHPFSRCSHFFYTFRTHLTITCQNVNLIYHFNDTVCRFHSV